VGIRIWLIHLHAEKIAQPDLINIVGDILVVLEIGTRDIAVSRLGRNIGL
jgi:hypothetical protein